MDLADIPLIDHHAHGILRAAPTLAAFFAVEPTERAVHEHRLGSDPAAYAGALMRATGTEILLVDDGFPPPGEAIGGAELGELADCPARPVLRIERVAQEGGVAAVRAAVATARNNGFAGLKTIAAYRGGLDLTALDGGRPGRVEGRATAAAVLAAFEANEATGDPLPVQVHTGFGDADLHLPRADPGHLKPLIERLPRCCARRSSSRPSPSCCMRPTRRVRPSSTTSRLPRGARRSAGSCPSSCRPPRSRRRRT